MTITDNHCWVLILPPCTLFICSYTPIKWLNFSKSQHFTILAKLSDFFQSNFSHKDFLEWHIFLKSFGWDLNASDRTVQYKTTLPSRVQCWEGVCTYLVQLQLPTLLCLGFFRAHLLVITGESSVTSITL